jgi:rhodanese-related sulfurtransferase
MQPDILAFLQKNIFLVAVCLLSGGMLLWPLLQKARTGAKEVSVPQAVQLINRRDAVVLDVRDTAEFDAGHIPNARHIPLAEVEKRLKELEKFKQRPVIVSCRSGTRAGAACGVLRKHGFAEVFALKGGILGWQQATMPLEKKA